MHTLYVVDRDNNDWETLATLPVKDPLIVKTLSKRTPESVRVPILNVFARWERTYYLNYFAVRQRLKQIAIKSWKRLNPKAIIQQSEIKEIAATNEAWFLFTDDDDFYNPDLIEALPTAPKSAIVTWEHTASGHYNFPMDLGKIIHSSYVDTNCYAVHSRYFNEGGEIEKVRKHGVIHDFFKNKTHHLKRSLSFVNRTPASISLFKRHFMFKPEMLDLTIERFNANLAWAEDAWYHEELEQVKELFARFSVG